MSIKSMITKRLTGPGEMRFGALLAVAASGVREPAEQECMGNTMTRCKRIVLAAVLGSLVVSLGACNTVKGVGRDIESVGRAGERAL